MLLCALPAILRLGGLLRKAVAHGHVIVHTIDLLELPNPLERVG